MSLSCVFVLRHSKSKLFTVHSLFELIYTTASINKLLLACEKGMAL